ncbi:MAG: VanW family protein, partial [Actinomycetota bacterium]
MKPRKAIFFLVPLAIALLPLAIYFADTASATDEVARNVTVAGVPIGGMNRADATLTVEAYENQLRTDTGVFLINGESFKLSPMSIDLTADIRSAIDAAFEARRDGSSFANLAAWVRSFSAPVDVSLTLTLDDQAVLDQLIAWESEAIPNPAFQGDVVVVDGVVVPHYPRAGKSLDHTTAHAAIVSAMSTLDKTDTVLEVVDSTPTLSDADVDAAAEEISLMIEDPITMISPEVGFRTTFKPEHLASAVQADINPDGSRLITSFNETRVLEILDPRRTEYEIEPIDAKFDINLETDEFTVVAGRSGTLLDTENLLIEMKQAALGSGTGKFPLLVGAEPDFTTQAAEAFTSLGPLAGFTTNHPARQPRVTNIHKMADTVNGAIVLPGEEWSINDHVGERTEAKGYVAAPAIINGAPYCCDHPANIGGGVSQFGTTLFNAVFYSCLEDVGHKPHSLYFTRYPMGREATLGVPGPDVRFGNNTEFPIVIATAYTDTSITVKMYGDNGGLTCADVTHDPEEIVPFEEELVADEEGVILPGEREQVRSGIDGFLVKVDRVVTYPDGHTETDLKLAHRYRPLSEQYLVHPCEVTGEPVNCPVQLPSLIDMTWDDAYTTLTDLGLSPIKVTGFVADESQHNVVLTQNTPPGEWL